MGVIALVMNDVTDILLRVEGLSVAFDERRVVEDVSYTLRRGRTLGIVGESGSGKSVSTMALMGLLPKQAAVSGRAWLSDEPQRVPSRQQSADETSGSIVHEDSLPKGTELLALDEEGFREIRGHRISMIFQEPMTSLNPVQRCGQQVMEMLLAHERVSRTEARRRVIELFEEVMLPRPEKIFSSYPHEISGGQKQRVMIAMALICHPALVIADEPTTALDVTVQKTILELLRTLQRKYNIGIIFITHDLGVIAQIADDVAVMYKGKIVEQGSAQQVLYSPRHPYTKGLLACRPPLDSRPRRLLTVKDFMEGNAAEEPQRQTAVAEHVVAQTEGREPLLRVRDLDVTYALETNLFGKVKKELKAVNGLSFDIYRGETVGLVGESGCGKSTLGRAILQLIEKSAGTVEFEGRPLDRLAHSELKALRRKMQIVFQDPYSSLNPRLTIGQAIMEPLRCHGLCTNEQERRERVLGLMQQVDLKAEWFDRYPHEFSGGQRQRVCIARALALGPELVVCDESVSALDVSVQAQVLNLLNDLKEQYGYTYLFITHDLSVVKFFADRIMVMQQGSIVEQGPSDQLFAHPQHPYTQRLLAALPRL